MLHDKLKRYLRDTYNLDVFRECYFDEEKSIEYKVKKEDYEKTLNLGTFTVDNVQFEINPEAEEMKESFAFKFKYKYLDNDSYCSDITKGGFKKYGVVSPEGKYYACGYSGHNNLEDKLIERGIIELNPEKGSSDCFEWWGWLVLSGAIFTDCEWGFSFEVSEYVRGTLDKEIKKQNTLTDAQIDQIVAYTKSLGREHFLFNHQWLHISEADYLRGLKDFEDYYEKVRCREGREDLDIDSSELTKQK